MRLMLLLLQNAYNDFGPDVEIVFDPPKDGNCQFTSISHQLLVQGINRSHHAVRLELIDYLSHSDLSEVRESVPHCDVIGYLKEMKKPRALGDNITLLAASKLYKQQILVLSSQGPRYTAIVTYDSSNHFNRDMPTIFLGHYAEMAGMHYVSLKPRAGSTMEEIVHSRLTNNADQSSSTSRYSDQSSSTSSSSDQSSSTLRSSDQTFSTSRPLDLCGLFIYLFLIDDLHACFHGPKLYPCVCLWECV